MTANDDIKVGSFSIERVGQWIQKMCGNPE